MSTAAKLTITKNTLSPNLRQAVSRLKDTTPIVDEMCKQVMAISVRSFLQSSLRAAPWPALADGSASRLIRTTALRKGIHITNLGPRQGTVQVNMVYGAIHQFGGKTGFAKRTTIPARPFMPFLPSGQPTDLVQKKITIVMEAKVQSLSGGAFKAR